jgi:aminopeptidase N
VSFDKSNSLISAQIRDESDMIGRLLACKSLETRKTHESVEMLRKVLQDDPFYGVRIAAARALAKHESDEAFAVLEESWQRQDDARVRLAVVERAVGRYHSRTPKLIAEILETESNPLIKAAAIKSLGRFHGDSSRRLIKKYLISDSFRNELAVAAISAIRQQNEPGYKDVLIDTLKQYESRFTSRGLSQGLAALAHVSQWQDDKEDVRQFLSAYVNHPMTTIRAGFSSLFPSRSISLFLCSSASMIPNVESRVPMIWTPSRSIPSIPFGMNGLAPVEISSLS